MASKLTYSTQEYYLTDNNINLFDNYSICSSASAQNNGRS